MRFFKCRFSWVHYQTICLQKKLAFPLGIVDLDKPRDKIGSNFATSSDLVQRRGTFRFALVAYYSSVGLFKL